VSLICRNNTGNLADVLHGIVEQHEVHLGVHFIVIAESVSQFKAEVVNLGELVVKFIIESSHEVGENKRLRCGFKEVLAQVEFGEGLFADFSSKIAILA
jgi:hypothetical protein